MVVPALKEDSLIKKLDLTVNGIMDEWIEVYNCTRDDILPTSRVDG